MILLGYWSYCIATGHPSVLITSSPFPIPCPLSSTLKKAPLFISRVLSAFTACISMSTSLTLCKGWLSHLWPFYLVIINYWLIWLTNFSADPAIYSHKHWFWSSYFDFGKDRWSNKIAIFVTLHFDITSIQEKAGTFLYSFLNQTANPFLSLGTD